MRSIANLTLILALLFWGAADAQQTSQPRDLAPGVLKIIPPAIETADSQSLRMPLPDLQAVEYAPNTFAYAQTLHGSTRDVVFFRDVWQYEFAHLGLRQMDVDVPNAAGGTQKKNIWYLVYRIRNTGKSVTYNPVTDEVVDTIQHEIVYDQAGTQSSTLAGKFFPIFRLVAWVQNPRTREYERMEYIDSVLPTVVEQIQLEEDPNTPLLDSIQISQMELPEARGASDGAVWGVAVWQNIDPRVDYVSVRVKGVTNGFRLVNNLDGTKSFQTRELQLQFFRPGDAVREVTDRVSIGVPLVDSPKEQAEIVRRYELPGPLFRVFEQVNEVEMELKLEADGQVDLDTFVSPLAITLDEGKLPSALQNALGELEVTVTDDVGVDQLVPGAKWSFSVDSRKFLVTLEPQFWEPFGEGARLIKRLEHAWVYR